MSYINKIKEVDLSKYDHGYSEEYVAQSWLCADQYAHDVLTEKIPSNSHVKSACARYIHDREFRKDLELRENESQDVIDFANKLKHIKGKLAGKNILLMKWMIFVLVNMFGWYYTDGERVGERRFIKTLVLVARGNAKSFLASIACAYTLLTSPNGAPAGYSVARTAKQASIVFNDAKKMLRGAEWEVASLFLHKAYETLTPVNDGEFRPLASEAQSMDGLRVAIGIADEVHAHNSADMVETLITGTSATVDPIIFMISTAGTNLDGVCVQERNIVREINADITTEDSYFGVEYSIEDEDNWEDEVNWIKANPSLGHAVNINTLRSSVVSAKQNLSAKKNFLTKYCNRFVNIQDNPYLDIHEVQTNCARENLNIKDYIGRECYVGLDLAQRFDLTALSILFPEDDGSITAFQRHYCAFGSLKKLTASKYEMYLQWEDDGHLVLTEGNSTDFEYIKDDIRWIAEAFDLQMVGYDPYAGSQMANELVKEGIEMVEVRQSYADLSEPAKLFQTLVADSLFNYQSTDKCFEWNVANSVCSTDKNENIKVHKAVDKPHDKVDSVVALITGLNPNSLKEPKKKNPYRERGMIIL